MSGDTSEPLEEVTVEEVADGVGTGGVGTGGEGAGEPAPAAAAGSAAPADGPHGPDASSVGADPVPGGDGPPGAGEAPEEQSEAVEADGDADGITGEVDLLGRALRERDDYLDALRHLQADFENYRKRVAKQQADLSARAAESLVEKLLPALDVADLAVAHGASGEVEQVWKALLDALEREGLERIEPLAGRGFDPTLHDAVAHEEGDGGGQEVAEVLRAGYSWKGRVLRPAMVKVRG